MCLCFTPARCGGITYEKTPTFRIQKVTCILLIRVSRYIIWSERYFTYQTRVSVQCDVTPPKFSGPLEQEEAGQADTGWEWSQRDRKCIFCTLDFLKKKSTAFGSCFWWFFTGDNCAKRVCLFVVVSAYFVLIYLFFYFLTVLLKRIFSFFKNFYWRVLGLQYHVSFRCTAWCFSYVLNFTYVYIPFQMLFPYTLL